MSSILRSACSFFLSSWLMVAYSQTIQSVGVLNFQTLRNSDLSNLWGYADEQGNEYALVGVNGDGSPLSGGLSVVDLSDPADPQEIFFAPGPPSIWREIKTWGDYAYVTTEADNGMLMIVDLGPLPQSSTLPVVIFHGDGWDTSHSLFIDENGRLYIHGANRGEGGVIMYDLTQDPTAPVEVGTYDPFYCHDSFARGDTLYAAHINDGFFTIVDVSDPAAPIVLGQASTPNFFTHNVWLDDSGDHLFTTDEKNGAFVGSYDIGDPSDIQEVDRLQSVPGTGAVPHNTYWLNDFLVSSYYTYGVTVYDATFPDNLVEVGHYDTSPFTGEGFNGCWGVYPFLPSGLLIASDIQTGLHVLQPQLERAAYLQGMVTSASTQQPIVGAQVQVVSEVAQDICDLDGFYALGVSAPGTYQVTYSALGYGSFTATGVVLATGQITELDVELSPLLPFDLSGGVFDESTGSDIVGAHLLFEAPGGYVYSATTDNAGDYTITDMYPASYTLTVGSWGHRTECSSVGALSSSSTPLYVGIAPGYADDFTFDLGWAVSGTAASGIWQRGKPVGTSFGGNAFAPGADATDDCGSNAYVTGNGGGGAGDDDVDDGNTVLTSPLFDATAFSDPELRFQRWFANDGGNTDPNDRLRIRLTNGLDTVLVNEAESDTPDNATWVEISWSAWQSLAPTSTMRLIVTTSDGPDSHLVEAALDRFELLGEPFVGIQEQRSTTASPAVWPDPTSGPFTVQLAADVSSARMDILDAQGSMVRRHIPLGPGSTLLQAPPLPGVYLLRIRTESGRVWLQRLVVV
jgi:choice-of-anchor B domain-containing protein